MQEHAERLQALRESGSQISRGRSGVSLLGDVETAPGGPDGSLVVGHSEIERSAVRKAEREIGVPLMEFGEIQPTHWCKAALHFEVDGDRFVLEIRVVPVDRQVVVDASDAGVSLEHLAVADRLLDQSFHSWLLA
jgi:hypothetical protein